MQLRTGKYFYPSQLKNNLQMGDIGWDVTEFIFYLYFKVIVHGDLEVACLLL